jgi:hypothetical protein
MILALREYFALICRPKKIQSFVREQGFLSRLDIYVYIFPAARRASLHVEIRESGSGSLIKRRRGRILM